MKVVDRAEHPPGLCAVTADIDGPFLDTEAWCPYVDPRIYIHVPVVEQMGREIGMVSGEKVSEMQAKLDEYGEKVRQLEALVAGYEKVKDLEEMVSEEAAA